MSVEWEKTIGVRNFVPLRYLSMLAYCCVDVQSGFVRDDHDWGANVDWTMAYLIRRMESKDFRNGFLKVAKEEIQVVQNSWIFKHNHVKMFWENCFE